MTPDHDKPNIVAEIRSLVNQWQEGALTPDETRRLNDLLLSSKEGRSLFREFAQIDAELHWMYADKKKAAALIDAEPEGETRPAAIIAQQRLGLDSDEQFIHGFQRCAGNESHLQAWLQIYPRMRALALLARGAAGECGELVARIVARFFKDYEPNVTADDLWAAARRAADEVDGRQQGHVQIGLGRALCETAFAGPRCVRDCDAVAVHEVLDEHVPHRFSANTLRLMCLHYLHGLSAPEIAVHLGRSPEEVRQQLARPRLELTQRCLEAMGDGAPQCDQDALNQLDRMIDSPPLSDAVASTLETWLRDDRRHAARALTVAVVHDYLGRQLSAVRLLDELSIRDDKSYLKAIELSLRDIESLSTPLSRQDTAGVTARGESSGPVKLAAILGLAAGLLIAVGIGISGGGLSDPSPTAPAEVAPLARNDKPKTKAAPVDPPLPPVVGVVSESLGLAAEDGERISIGTLIRMNDAIAFREGLVQVSMTTGSTMVLQGPVEAAVDKASLISLHHGRMTGLNANGAEPLIVQSPSSRVVDLGTEFGVAVSADAGTSVSVYDGEVDFIVRADSAEASPASLRLEAGWEAHLDDQGALPGQASPLTHEREFVRADEIQLRKEANAGMESALATLDFYELLRTDGLIAYQGFDVESQGRRYSLGFGDLAIGFGDPTVRQRAGMRFGPNILDTPPLRGSSGAIEATKGVSYYLDLDTSERGFLAKEGLVDANGFVGLVAGEMWIAWRTKSVGAASDDFGWAGLSLMCGDNRRDDEPLFIGLPAQLPVFGLHTHPSEQENAETRRIPLDRDPSVAGIQSIAPDDREHLWVLRLRMDGKATESAVWCDVPAHLAAATPPQAVYTVKGVKFDRFRFECEPNGEAGAWRLDDLVVALSPDAIAAVLERRSQSGQGTAP